MEDNLKSLFEAIRMQDAVLWVGAGFSRYAGYKTGADLCKRFYKEIAKGDREGVEKNNLQKVTHALKYLYKEKGKQKIIDILTTEYINKKPVSQEYHDKLSKIPHISTIITTNYDRMLELSYKKKAHLIYRDNDITSKEKGKVDILKIHGHLADPESIIITEKDYQNFFLKGKEKNIWKVVSERIATKSQILLGYGFEDINVINTFYEIWRNIDEKKPCYLIAPDLKKPQIARLNDMGIIYINLSGEKFIDELYQNIKDNIEQDRKEGKVDIDAYLEFMTEHDIAPIIKASKTGHSVTSFRSTDENSVLSGHVKFTIKNKHSANNFTDFLTGKILNEVAIPIDFFSFEAHGILLAKNDSNEETFFIFKRIPKEYIVDIRFKETSYERNDISVKFVVSESNAECIVDLKQGKLIVKMEDNGTLPMNYRFVHEHNSQYGKTKDEIEYFEFLLNLVSGSQLTAYLNNEPVYTNRFSQNQIVINSIEFFLQYFKKLKRIENYYDFQFGNFDLNSIDNVSNTYVNNLITLIDNKSIEYVFDVEIAFNYEDLNIDFANRMLNGEKGDELSIVKQYLKEEKIILHNKTIVLGFKQETYMSMYLTNLEPFSIVNPVIKMKSQDKKIKVAYLKELPEEDRNINMSDLPSVDVSIDLSITPTDK